LGEYSEVGNTIEEFASSDATVVVGTVIDPEMTNELRVTVVATGLGVGVAAKEARPASTKVVVDNTRGAVSRSADFAPSERPAGGYRANTHGANAAALAAPLGDKELEYLDIPAFLRRQAD